ncbi:EamA family transporter [Halorarum halophilum]|uniref:EamA family transporter n=1 Tax=Halorarum halophilum TaxID=2743090 RepID=A0A7D5L301_9EURY|nr:DMT family transporter [Halobaculum halophilum]QLG29343.1 EamA family transporter [Halobaculum halophilum]
MGRLDSRTVGTLLVLVSAVCFATLGVLGELAFRAGLSVPAALALRFLVGGAVVWAALGTHRLLTSPPHPRLRLPTRDGVVAVALGAVGYAGVSYGFFVGVERTSVGLAAVLLYTYPLFVVALAAAFLDERVGGRTAVAAVLTFAGVGLVSWTGAAAFDPLGAGATLAAALLYACYITASRVALRTADERVLTAYVAPAAAASMGAVGAATGTFSLPTTPFGWGVVLALGTVTTALAIFAFFAGLKRVGASRTGVVSTVEPAVAVALGAAFLGEVITPEMLLGTGLILAGVVLVQTARE